MLSLMNFEEVVENENLSTASFSKHHFWWLDINSLTFFLPNTKIHDNPRTNVPKTQLPDRRAENNRNYHSYNSRLLSV